MEEAENTRFIYQFRNFVLDPYEKTLFADGRPLHLPAKEFETLLLLVQNNGKALSKEQMMKLIWPDAVVEEGNLAKQISRLRKIFNADGEPLIVTLPKHGYRFSADIRQLPKPGEETSSGEYTTNSLTFRVKDEARKSSQLDAAGKKRGTFIGFGVAALLALVLLMWYWRTINPSPRINSIAVLPLKSLTRDERNEALGLGLTDALISKIGSLRTVAVRPTSSVTKYIDSTDDALAIGKKLNVDAVLEGTIQQAEGRVRINVNLLSVESGEQLWTSKFEADSTKIFDLEDRLSEQTARALGLKFGVGENGQLTRNFTNNAAAFDDYLKGRYSWNKRTEEGFRQAIDYFKKAVERDPNFALAYSGLADCYILLGVWGAEKPKDVFPQAERFAENALKADPQLAEALVSRAFVRWVYDWDVQKADAEFLRAIELNPNYATVHHWYSYFLVSQNRFEEAIVEIKKARELEGPLNISVNTDIGEIYCWAGKYNEADRQLREVIKIEPNYAVAHHVLAINLLQQNRIPEAIAAGETARRLESGPRVLAVLAFAYAAGGEREKALKFLVELNELSAQKYVSPFSRAIAQLGLGNRAAALSELETAYLERSDAMAILGIYPLLENLRADPRFIRLQEQVNQSPHLMTGKKH
jgi:DNA-binding winged helix-turn-helix (wHTH) protein/TolB-like protein/Tfp pilus assembly protein PilF